MKPLQIVSHTHQVPFQGNFLQPTQRELLKTQNPLNNPNDWFDTGLAAQIAAATCRSSQLLFHRPPHSSRLLTRVSPPLPSPPHAPLAPPLRSHTYRHT